MYQPKPHQKNRQNSTDVAVWAGNGTWLNSIFNATQLIVSVALLTVAVRNLSINTQTLEVSKENLENTKRNANNTHEVIEQLKLLNSKL